jgi:hypothetical protein
MLGGSGAGNDARQHRCCQIAACDILSKKYSPVGIQGEAKLIADLGPDGRLDRGRHRACADLHIHENLERTKVQNQYVTCRLFAQRVSGTVTAEIFSLACVTRISPICLTRTRSILGCRLLHFACLE